MTSTCKRLMTLGGPYTREPVYVCKRERERRRRRKGLREGGSEYALAVLRMEGEGNGGTYNRR